MPVDSGMCYTILGISYIIHTFIEAVRFDSEPIPDEEVREEIIDNERDPERSLFNYSFKSIMSGIKSGLTKSPNQRNNCLQMTYNCYRFSGYNTGTCFSASLRA